MKIEDIGKSVSRNYLAKLWVKLNCFEVENFPRDTPNARVGGAMDLIEMLVGKKSVMKEWSKHIRKPKRQTGVKA